MTTPWRLDPDDIQREREAARQRAWEQSCRDANIKLREPPAWPWLAGDAGRRTA